MRPAPLVFVAALGALSACGKDSPPTPTPTPEGTETIRGTERLGWDQRAADTVELATFRYAIYVDGTRSELGDVSCGSTAGPSGFSCSGRLPALAAGQHTLELAAFVLDGNTTLESARSAPLRVNVTSVLAGVRSGSLVAGDAGTTSDGVPLRLDIVLDDVDEPSDLVCAPDGRLFIAERDGVLRVVDLSRGSQSTSGIDRAATSGDGRAEIVALALDRDFASTRHVFAATVAPGSMDGEVRDLFSIARYREVNGTLGERMVLLSGVPARTDRAAASLGIGPDGLLYVVLDDGGDARTADGLASLNGTLLRLNRDGTTPDEPPADVPAPSKGYRSPRALDWGPGGVLWIADGSPRSPERLSGVVVSSARPRRIRTAVSYALADNTDPSDGAVYRGDMFPSFRGDLFIAAEAGSHLLRVRLDPRSPTRVIATERLLEGVGPLRAIAIGPDGAIYVATRSAIGRIARRLNPDPTNP